MKKYSIGIDVGGTKILCALIENETHKVIFEVKKKTKNQKGNEKLTTRFFEALDELFKISKVSKKDISIIGIASAGQIDRKNGVIVNACNLQCKNLNIKELVEKKYKIDTYVVNDVEASTISEIMLGNAKDVDDFVCIFIGTGIGSSIVKNKKIHSGANNSAGELGHTIVQPNGRACSCGNFGCLEAYSSRSAIENTIKGSIKRGRKTIITELCDVQNISTKHIKEALLAHDEVVRESFNEATEYLSCSIANVINFYNPQMIILGGGLIQGLDEFYVKTVRKAKGKALFVQGEEVIFKKSFFGDYSGVIGASLIPDYLKSI